MSALTDSSHFWEGESTINRTEHFKQQIREVFEEDNQLFDQLVERSSRPLDLENYPTRSSILGRTGLTEDQVRRDVPEWAKNVQCPRCGTIMTPVRAKPDRQWGENITYQCHGEDKNGRLCLLVVQLTTVCNSVLRPGDFSESDWNWREVAKETPIVTENTTVSSSVTRSTEGPVVTPPLPWKREVLNKAIWEAFWEIYFEVGPHSVPIRILTERVKELRPTDTSPHSLRKIDEKIAEVPQMIRMFSGFAVKKIKDSFFIIGKSKGDHSLYPYSDPTYRKDFGFE